MFSSAERRLQDGDAALQHLQLSVGESDDGGGSKRRQSRVGFEPRTVLIDGIGRSGESGGRSCRVTARFGELTHQVPFRPQRPPPGALIVDRLDPHRPVDGEGKLVVEVEQPLTRPVREGPRRWDLRQTRERLITGPMIGVLDCQVPPMRRPVRIGPAATLEIHGVTVQPDHRRPIRSAPFVGEWWVGQTSKHRPLIKPTHRVGVEASERKMLGKLFRQKIRRRDRRGDTTTTGGCRRATEERPDLRGRRPDPIQHPSTTTAVSQPNDEEPQPLIHRLCDEPTRGMTRHPGPTRCPTRIHTAADSLFEFVSGQAVGYREDQRLRR